MCKFVAATSCTWSVHAQVLPSSEVLCVKRFDSVHTCGAAVRTYRNLRTGSELVSIVVADRVRGQPLVRPTDVVFDLKNDYGLDISYQVAWLGVEKAKGEVYGDHAMSFDHLRWYSESIMEKNPNSYINLEFDQKSGRFVRYFILFRAFIDGFNHCRPLLFLDGTFLKGRLKGNLLAATAKDDNQGANIMGRCVRTLPSLSIIGSVMLVIFLLLDWLICGTIYPISTVEKTSYTPADYMITPPTIKLRPSRPKWKRIPSRGEVV
ncbi:hypothetical protein ACSBR2_000286 [Camellia fascicularis]